MTDDLNEYFELHNQVSIFLDKALLTLDSWLLAILLTTVFPSLIGKYYECKVFILYWWLSILFSLILVLISYIISLMSIDKIIDNDEKKLENKKWREKVKELRKKIVFWNSFNNWVRYSYILLFLLWISFMCLFYIVNI